ncbi:hypothetical protein S7711_07272 [Stachybotrys chartarum IBT 7711]|uniref:Glutathione S-transferase n=1 Tax=Stachybotrys chartarum (strain CBS 109288 / IBT 7711) TaxID=1280523 RepID=A0A084ASA4_STACB|nr:hypothetical protein S7711_07272 [Stachybotrys chartarum IBT 7711]KFA45733.1 hypothetical protein S40293_09828 [Stachybotrys chartarum IBT 40293]KFA76662.1 hypothetical protein S40288_04434 [Stachybotrys chartarum IBT 40288]
MASLKPLVLHGHDSAPNPPKVAIILKELNLPYEKVDYDFVQIKQEPFISLNPNGRMPALVDPNNNDITLFESGAIIDYLVATYDKSHTISYPPSDPKYHITRCWEHFQMSGQGPYFGQKVWFERNHPEKIESAIERYRNEMKRVTGVIDSHLKKGDNEYLTGDRVTYADLMFIPWIAIHPVFNPEVDLSEYEAYGAWVERLMKRPAVKTVVDVMLAGHKK